MPQSPIGGSSASPELPTVYIYFNGIYGVTAHYDRPRSTVQTAADISGLADATVAKLRLLT
jgi:hypothetical protein